MAVTTYQATARFLRNGETKSYVNFFSGRGPKTLASAERAAEAWIKEKLEEHGAWSCDATVAKVIYHIKG